MSSDSNMGGLIKMGGNLENPRDAKATDWPSVGPTGAEGEASGKNKLITQTLNQEGPRHAEDGGVNEPSVWGNTGQFAPAKSKGESGTAPTSMTSKRCVVNLENGQMIPNAEIADCSM